MSLEQLRQVFNSALIGNCRYTQETTEKAIAEAKV